jgi:hypothetical protein
MFTQERLKASFLLDRSGIVLYLVMAVLIVTVMVAGMFLNLILSHSRLTHHTVSRTQAYYAARLGMNYAIEMLSKNETGWTDSDPFNRTICASDSCYKKESDLPATINNITIYVGNLSDTANCMGVRCLNVTVDYQYKE